MSQAKNKIPVDKAIQFAQRFMAKIRPYVEKMEIVGSVRRCCLEVGDIEICCVDKAIEGLDIIFGDGNFRGMVVNGKRLKRFKYPESNLQIELYITSPEDYGRILAIRTGSATFSHHKLAVTWNRLGWAGTSDGLRRKKECEKKGGKWVYKPGFNNSNCTKPPPFPDEVSFFEFLGIEWVKPIERSWTDRDGKYNY